MPKPMGQNEMKNQWNEELAVWGKSTDWQTLSQINKKIERKDPNKIRDATWDITMNARCTENCKDILSIFVFHPN